MSALFVAFKGGKGPALVLLHGWGFTSQVWQPLFLALTEHYAVYIVDLPGFGQSELMDWPQFKAALLNALPERFAILGWSMGGGYGIQLASEHPEIVTHLICVGASPKFIRDETWPGIDAGFFDAFSSGLSLDPIQTLKAFIKAQTGKEPTIEKDQLPPQAAMAASLDLLKTWDLRDALTRVEHACFMFGRLDRIIPVETLAVMQKRYPAFDYVLFQREAHMPFVSNREAFLKELKRVLG